LLVNTNGGFHAEIVITVFGVLISLIHHSVWDTLSAALWKLWNWILKYLFLFHIHYITFYWVIIYY